MQILSLVVFESIVLKLWSGIIIRVTNIFRVYNDVRALSPSLIGS